MIRHPLTLLFTCCTFAVVAGTFGCAPPAPSEEDILYYLRNARVQGKVRRAGPAGQAYLDSITKANAALRKELDLLREVATPESLWAPGDPRWRDKETLRAELAALEKLCHEHKLPREQAYDKLEGAVEKVPEELALESDSDKSIFIDDVWSALTFVDSALDAQVVFLEQLLQERLALYRAVLNNSDDLDSTQSGLVFMDESKQATVTDQYDAFETKLITQREMYIAFAERELLESKKSLKAVDKRKQRMEYDYLEYKSKYIRDTLESYYKDLDALIDQAEEELNDLQKKLRQAEDKEKSKQKRQVEFQTGWVDELRITRDAIKARVEGILERADALGTQVDESGD